MADVEQVSSTTQNQVEGEERKSWHESETGDPSDAAAYGGFDREQYVTPGQKPFEAAATGGSPFEFHPEEMNRMEEDEDVLAENKAETEWQEKSNLISYPGQEPDSTRKEYVLNRDPYEMDLKELMQKQGTGRSEAHEIDLEELRQKQDTGRSEAYELDLEEVMQRQSTAVSVGFTQDFSPVGHEKEEPVVSSHTDPEQDFSSFAHDKVVTHEVEQFTSQVIQEQMISSSHVAQPKDDIFKSYDHKESQEQGTDISASVKQPEFSEFAEPQKAFGSFMDEKEGQQRDISAQPVLEETFKSAPVEDTPAAPASPIHEPSLPSSAAVPFPTLTQVNSDNGNSLIDLQANSKTTMDSFNDSPSRSMSKYDPDVLNLSDDDLMFETKKNPVQDFSPLDHPGKEFSHFGDTAADVRAAVMSDSPSPDLVQNAHEGELPDDEEQSLESRDAATESLRQQLASSDFFSSKDQEESGLPPSLPDILKSSPLKPEKVDSGSSEGSPDFSPVHRSGNDSPNAPFSLSANNPFAFEAKVPLLKEMTEETEARAAEKARQEEENTSEQTFGTFDLVKEAEISPKGTETTKTTVEDQDDFKTLSQDSVQSADKFECLNFPTKKAQEHSDSESPSADSLSPVLEAMAKNPESFQIEPEKNFVEEEDEDEVEAADEVSEQEVSSEEFEFVEKPPRGAVDEFLESLENAKLAKASEVVVEETGSKFDDKIADQIPMAQETKNQSSYFLLTEPSDATSPARGKAGLELADLQVHSQAPLVPSVVVKTETVTVKKVEPKDIKLPNLNPGSVVELLYWRDVKNSGIVFGASLLLLLSLSVCSIISVLSYVALALLSVTISFRIYKGVLQAIQKSDEGHPFKLYLEQDVALPEDVIHKYSEVALGRINAAIIELRRLFLVEDLVDSLKFAILMWILTYIGALFNGLTILILGLVGAFTCPIIYEKHQAQIDHYIALVSTQVKDIVGKIQSKIPGAKKKAE